MESASDGLLIAPFGPSISFRDSSPIVLELPLSPPAESVDLGTLMARWAGASAWAHGKMADGLAVCCQPSRVVSTPRPDTSPPPAMICSGQCGTGNWSSSRPRPSSLPRSCPRRRRPGPKTAGGLGDEVEGPHRWTDRHGGWHSDGYCAHWHSSSHSFPQQHWI